MEHERSKLLPAGEWSSRPASALLFSGRVVAPSRVASRRGSSGSRPRDRQARARLSGRRAAVLLPGRLRQSDRLLRRPVREGCGRGEGGARASGPGARMGSGHSGPTFPGRRARKSRLDVRRRHRDAGETQGGVVFASDLSKRDCGPPQGGCSGAAAGRSCRPPASGPIWRASPARVLEDKTFSVVTGTTGETWLAGRLNDFQLTANVDPRGKLRRRHHAGPRPRRRRLLRRPADPFGSRGGKPIGRRSDRAGQALHLRAGCPDAGQERR